MTHEEIDDRLRAQLSHLAVLAPDAARTARVRARCRTQLARRMRTTEPAPGLGRRVLAPIIVLGVCGIYVYSLVSTALHLTGIL